jgi:hypothetical protein
MASSGRKRSLSGPCTSTPSKHKKYVCKYHQFWEKEFTWLKKPDTGEDMAHCKQTVKGEYKNHILEKWIM